MTWEERGMASDGVQITGPRGDRYDEVLTPEAVNLVAALQRELGARRAGLLAARAQRQEELSAGAMLDFLPATRQIRDDPDWRVAAPARDWWTDGLRSPGRPTRRWRSTR